MEELFRLVDIELTIVTLVPEWFLRSSYFGPFTLYPLQTDVGLVQQGPLEQDTGESWPGFLQHRGVGHVKRRSSHSSGGSGAEKR